MSNFETNEVPVNKKRRLENNESREDIPENTCPQIQTFDAKFIKKNSKKKPAVFRLKNSGENASLSIPNNERVPLMLTDIQFLLLHGLFGNLNLTQAPRWYVLERSGKIHQITCLILEGLGIQHWEKHSDDFVYMQKTFKNSVEILTPSVYNGSLVQELALVPLSEVDKDNLIQKYGSMTLALETRKDLMIMIRACFPIKDGICESIESNIDEKFPRTQLILSAWQLVEENYPVPLKGKLQKAYSDYIMTSDEYEPVTSTSPMFGLDCEMCMTNAGSEVTRVSLVNEKYETIYDCYVKPYNEITDYLTRYSGITKSLLENVSKRLEDVQKDIRQLLPPDAILVGQSVNIDLHALKMMHPYIIDTSLIFNIVGERFRKSKLKVLAKEFLNIDIQTGKSGHSSVEDSLTSLKLVQLKLRNSLEYGDAVHTNRQKYKENVKIQAIKTEQYALSIFNHMIEQKKTSVIVGCDNITGDYHTYLSQAKEISQLKKCKLNKIKLITVDDEEDVIDTICNTTKEYNFAMAHLKLDNNSEVNSVKLQQVDEWVNKISKRVQDNTLLVVVFGGTKLDNGVAMVKVKT